MKLSNLAYCRAAVITPEVHVADIAYNIQKHAALLQSALENSAQLIVFPELSITGYTCGDLFFQQVLLDKAENALCEFAALVPDGIIAIVGVPIRYKGRLFNCAAIIEGGVIHHIVPKTALPNYAEFYEQRWFASAHDIVDDFASVLISDLKGNNHECGFGSHVVFSAGALTFGVELCEDLWVVNPPSNALALNGALVIANLSASNETVGKAEYRTDLVRMHSASTITAYCYANAGASESTTDTVFSGHSLIAENGKILTESKRLQLKDTISYADIDLDLLRNERLRSTTFATHEAMQYSIVELPMLHDFSVDSLERHYSPLPFVPGNSQKIQERSAEIIAIQATALAKRLKHTGIQSVVLGLSGGLDSTLALLACLETFELLDLDKKNIVAITMPGLGTTTRTHANAILLAEQSGITVLEIPIHDAVMQHFQDIGHNPTDHSLVFENAQARERTQILMDKAHSYNALVVGTGDMSELALGWCTYNGDHMSMYGINAGIPKTLVKVLVESYASLPKAKAMYEALMDIIATPVSPELLPAKDDAIMQKTEDIVGPYILHDFFLFYMLRHGFSPKKIIAIAHETFSKEYSLFDICTWLLVFYKRFFSQQFKRSSMPDGPKIGSIALSPRSDLRMPSDAHAQIWLEEVQEIMSELS